MTRRRKCNHIVLGKSGPGEIVRCSVCSEPMIVERPVLTAKAPAVGHSISTNPPR